MTGVAVEQSTAFFSTMIYIMKTIAGTELNELSKTLSEVDYFVIGEVHGIHENAEIISLVLQEALKTNRDITVSFEWLLSEAEVTDLNSLISNGIPVGEIPDFFFDSDGRFTEAHIQLLRTIRTINMDSKRVTLATFDANSEDYEQVMAGNLTSMKQGNNLILVETGVTHARRHNLGPPQTFVDHLAQSYKVANVFLQYQSGTVQVEDQILPILDSAEQERGPQDNFDYTIVVPHCNPANGDTLLTELKSLYRLNGTEAGQQRGKTR